MRLLFCMSIGAIGAVIAGAFGGWDSALLTLGLFMLADYITGLIVAGVFHNSPKTADGTLESKAGLKGLLRKGGILLVVLIACRLDLMFGQPLIRDGVIIAFLVNETLSLIENLGLMGVPMPGILTEAIGLLKNKTDGRTR